ncbi:hypothetical protein J4E00_00935 [Siccationidurans soli]|uniref:Transposase n=1 Tax=Hymenobacter negativus TaxID=2795026 RepID=A0ABS3Q8M5_9BACT|nr:hypothetical protein [Hymenobacter negativus]
MVNHFRSVNAHRLLTGEGDPFLSSAPLILSTNLDAKKNSRNQVQVAGANQQGSMSIADSAALEKDLAAARKEIALLTSHLADKERIIQLLERGSK